MDKIEIFDWKIKYLLCMDLKLQGQEKEENGKHLKTSTLKNGKKAAATQIRGGNEVSSIFSAFPNEEESTLNNHSSFLSILSIIKIGFNVE